MADLSGSSTRADSTGGRLNSGRPPTRARVAPRRRRPVVLLTVLVVVGAGIGAALAFFLPGPVVYSIEVDTALGAPAPGVVLEDCVAAVEESLGGWLMFGANVHKDAAPDDRGRTVRLEAPWWGPPINRGSSMISHALARLETQSRTRAAEQIETLASLQTELDRLRLRLATLDDLLTPASGLPSSVLESVAGDLADELDLLEAGIRAEQRGQSALLAEWTDLRRPTTAADLPGLAERVADAESHDRVLIADQQALQRATKDARSQLQSALDAAAPTLDALKTEIGAFVDETTDAADRSPALKADAQAIRQLLAVEMRRLEDLAPAVTQAREELRSLDGELIGREIRHVQRTVDDQADNWTHDSTESFTALIARIDQLTSNASTHRTPALVAQSRFQSHLTRASAAREAAVRAVRAFSTRHNHRLDGAVQSMLGLQLRVEDRREQIRAAIEQRLRGEAEERRLVDLANAEEEITPSAENVAGRTNGFLATHADLEDVTALLARSRAEEAADAARVAEADRLRRAIAGLQTRFEDQSRKWVPPVRATLLGAERRLPGDDTRTRVTVAGVVAVGAFILLTIIAVPFAFRGRSHGTNGRPRPFIAADYALTGDGDESVAAPSNSARGAQVPTTPPSRPRSRV
jgi:hypothetical protein